MHYYQEITLIEQTEISLYFIWSKLYMQLHLAFVEHKDEQDKIPYGVSFPEYQINEQKKAAFLGSKIRIFAHSEQELQKLDLNKWLCRLTDYVHVSTPREVPQKKITGYVHYFRFNPKANISIQERIARQAKRHHVSLSEAEAHFADYIEKPLEDFSYLPYINLQSLSRHSLFRLYIGKKIVAEELDGKFGTYGLSRTATVPEF